MFILTFFWVKDQIVYLAEYLDADPTERAWVLFQSYSLYDPINFFHILHWDFGTLFWWGITILTIASLMLYRPFCYIACPVGALTWFLEKVAPGRIRIDHDACHRMRRMLRGQPLSHHQAAGREEHEGPSRLHLVWVSAPRPAPRMRSRSASRRSRSSPDCHEISMAGS